MEWSRGVESCKLEWSLQDSKLECSLYDFSVDVFCKLGIDKLKKVDDY